MCRLYCLGSCAVVLLLLAATYSASDLTDYITGTECQKENSTVIGTCLRRECCRDKMNVECGIGGEMNKTCTEGRFCCSPKVTFKSCMDKKGRCLPLGCGPNEENAFVIAERNHDCGPFHLCWLPGSDAVKPTCTLKESAPTCGQREGTLSESTDIRANRWEFPWSVAIFCAVPMSHTTMNVFLCGGSLLEDGTILTTAECVDGFDTDSLRVHLGRWNLGYASEECTQVKNVTKKIAHENYDTVSKENNIALLVPSGSIQWSSAVNAICLPESSKVNDSDRCYITGWDQESTRSVNYVLKFNVRTNGTLDDCRRSVEKHHPSSTYVLSPGHGCAMAVNATDKHYPCARVTGSGLVCQSQSTGRYYLRGIALYALRQCSLSVINDLYVDVGKYLNWISTTAGKK